MSPSLADARSPSLDRWTLDVQVGTEPWQVSANLCTADGRCRSHTSQQGTPDAPTPAVAEVLRLVAETLDRSPSEAALAAWSDPLPGDDYARLVAGRAAAAYYGLSEPIPEEHLGDARRDPVLRAIRLNPSIVVTAWIGARRETERGHELLARQLMVRAREARPSSQLLRADTAALLDRWGSPVDALLLWDDVNRESPRDERFAVGRARTAMHAGRAEDAWESLHSLPESVQRGPVVVELMVDAARATHRDGPYALLLEVWQEVAPEDPEPVRLRVQERVRSERYADALGLTPELRARGAVHEADETELALLAALGRFSEAATRANDLGDRETSRRLMARAEDSALPWLASDRSRAARRWVAEDYLRRDQPTDALVYTEGLLREQNYDPLAHQLRATALDALGRPDDAVKSREMADRSLVYGVVVVPSTAAGSAR